MPKISVIIGSYNQRNALQLVLNGFSLQTLLDFELIVVDSSSTDGTKNLLENFHPPYIFRYSIQDNQGKTGARNAAAAMAEAPILLITDADMIPEPTLIETHVNAHAHTKEATCFEGMTLNMHMLQWPSAPENFYPYIQEKIKPGKKLGWYYFLTGNLSMPTQLFRQFDGFDMNFQGYGWEDLELGYRLSRARKPLRYLPAAKNYHYHVVTDDDLIRRAFKKGESAAIFLKKHPELKWFLGLNPLANWLARNIHENSQLYIWAERLYQSKTVKKRQFGRWLLGEYYYRKGIFKVLDKKEGSGDDSPQKKINSPPRG